MRRLVLISMLFSLSVAACMPYKSEFSCPENFNGKCVSVQEAYQEALEDSERKDRNTEGPFNEMANGKEGMDSIEQSYQKSVLSRLTALLDDPVTPLVAPAQVLRILILSYPSQENNLFMPREIYTFVDEPKWVLGGSRALEKD